MSSDPEDPESLMVVADQLLSAGDRRGELIMLQLLEQPAQAQHQRMLRLRFDLEQELFGCLGATAWRTRWRSGFLRELHVVAHGLTSAGGTLLKRLRERGCLERLEHLRLVGTATFDQAMQELLAWRWAELHALELGPTNLGAGRLDLHPKLIAHHLPNLRLLRLPQITELGFGHPKLKTLLLATQSHCFERFDQERFPSLAHLELKFRDAVPRTPLLRIQGLHLVLDNPAGWHPTAVFSQHCDPSKDELLTPPPRLQRLERHGRFWSIERKGNVLLLRYGIVGNPGHNKRRVMADPYTAATEQRKRLATKLEQGYREVFVPADEA